MQYIDNISCVLHMVQVLLQCKKSADLHCLQNPGGKSPCSKYITDFGGRHRFSISALYADWCRFFRCSPYHTVLTLALLLLFCYNWKPDADLRLYICATPKLHPVYSRLAIVFGRTALRPLSSFFNPVQNFTSLVCTCFVCSAEFI